jgi:L-fucono-1,5-lactonase
MVEAVTWPHADAVPIIDTHIHLFDPTRPQGIPWPGKEDGELYQPTLPDRFRKVTKGLGVVGAIEIECSSWLEDNEWVLNVASGDTIMLGTVGNLEAGKPGFRKNLDRFRKNPLFRGIRYGNLWGRDFSGEVSRPEFIADMQALADADLALDTANPNPDLISTLVRLTDKVPSLRVVIDHLPQCDPPAEAKALAEFRAHLRELGKRPQVFVKVSEVLRRVNGAVPEDLDFYRSRLDELWDIFGADRLLYGSDWPNSDRWAAYPKVLNVVREYFFGKGSAVAEKYFWRNSMAAYRWVKRAPTQP